jgi:hypothetical protein
MRYLLVYAHACGVLTAEECQTYWERTWQALGEAAQAQHEHQAGEEPVERFRALLAAALTAGLAHVAAASTRTDPPLTPKHWGWRGHERRMGEDTEMVWQPLGACIGWLHGERLYLDPEAAFSVVQRLADSQQAPLPVTQQTLWKRMHEQGVLRRETGQQKNQVRRTIGGKREYVVDIPALYIQETGPSGPSGPYATQAQQNQRAPLDLFPAWYQQKPVHSETTKPVHTTQPQSPSSWTDSESRTGPVFHTESVHTNSRQAQQSQGRGPIGPLGPEMESREDAGYSLTPATCSRCGADQVSLVQRHGRPACVGCSLLSDDALARRRPSMPANGTQAPAPGLPLQAAALADACPQCGATLWHQRLTYRLCQRCQYKDGLTPQEIREQQ